MSAPRILVFGAWDDGPGYPRTRAWLQGLDAAGQAPTLWRLPSPFAGQKRLDVVRCPWRWPGAACRLAAWRRRARAELTVALRVVRPDVVVLPYPGHALAPIVRQEFAGKIVLDLFLSAHDTVIDDRAWFRPNSWPARRLLALDRGACAAADVVLLDTPAHAAHVAALCGLDPQRVTWLPVGDPDAPAVALPVAPASAPLHVLFFGTGVPLHGLLLLVEAAHACAGLVRLEVIGGSRAERAAIAAQASPHVQLGAAFVARRELTRAMARAHLVAGVFGASAKAQRVIPFKVVHAMAAGRAVLTGDTVAVRAWLRDGEDVLLAPTGDAEALAARLRAVAMAPERLASIGQAARATFVQRFSAAALARRWQELLPTIFVTGEQEDSALHTEVAARA